MSQIEINNNNFNSVDVQNTVNNIDVNQGEYIIVVPQEITSIIEIFTPGPKGDKGEPGDPTLFTSSFISTASFDLFTASYYLDSSSFDSRINSLTSSLPNGLENYLALFNSNTSLTSSNIHITGSTVAINSTSSNATLTVNTFGSGTALDVQIENKSVFKINEEGVLEINTFNYTPTAVTGGIFFSASNEYFLGFV